MTTRNKLATTFAMAFVATVAVALLATAPVSAHARYKSSTPNAGEVLTASPASVSIFFTEQVQKVAGTYAIEVTRDRGASVTAGEAVVDDADRTHLTVTLASGLGPGRYVINWKNTSDDDGDPATGAFSFYINTQPTAVDLDNDRQLASIGFEDVTATAAAGGATPEATSGVATAASTTAGPTRPPSTTSPGISAATPIPTTSATKSSGDGGNTAVYVVIAIGAVVAAGGFGAWWYTSRRGR